MLIDGVRSMVEFFIPGNPKPKERPRKGNFGFYTPKETSNYEGVVAINAKLAMHKYNHKLMMGPVKVILEINYRLPEWKSKKKLRNRALEEPLRHVTTPDIDNAIKSVLDGLNGICFKDDAQVSDIQASKRYSKEAGVYVSLRELPQFEE